MYLRWKVGIRKYVSTYEHRVADGRVTDQARVKFSPPRPVTPVTTRSLRPGEPIPPGTPKRYYDSRGYVRLRWLIGTQTYVETYEHRVTDGYVTTSEHVHHDNEIKDDNTPGNLIPLTAEEHGALHAADRRSMGRWYPYRSRYAWEKATRARVRRERLRTETEEMRRMFVEDKLTTIEIGRRVGISASNVSRRLRGIGFRCWDIRPAGWPRS